MDKKIKYWVEVAEYDIDSAKVLLKGKKYLYVGFMCHQTIEKILKAYYVFLKKKNASYTHNLNYLAQENGLLKLFNEEQKNLLATLTPLNIEARYPSYKENILKSLNNKKCSELIKNTKELFLWIQKRLTNK